MGHVWQTRPTFWQRHRAIMIILVVVLLFAAGGGLLWRATHSWSSYSDSNGHLRIPVAPGWFAGGFYNGPLDNTNCEYSVIVYPPGATATFSKPGVENDLRLLLINVVFPCLSAQLSPDYFTNPLPTPVTIGGKRTTLYDTGGPGVGRLAVTTFGGSQYQFVLDSQPSSTAQDDLAIFMRILAGFHYTGNG
jgi:hypothetical protein